MPDRALVLALDGGYFQATAQTIANRTRGDEPMRICCLNSPLAEPFRRLGHDVLDLRPGPGLYDIAGELARLGFTPDLLFQQETLGPRVVVHTLSGLDCPCVYWSIDTHLNGFWQRFYGRLFDLVVTTQKAWLPALEAWGIRECGWLPWYGSHRPLKPASERDLEAAFVGRVTAHRTMRQWFTYFLSGRYPFSRREDLPFDEMLDFYDRALVVPNESIFGEVNFRTFEAASCGCAVVNPDLGDAIRELFADGGEQFLYSDVLELEEHIDRLLGDDGLAERMGRAARERVVRDHLPEHRAKRVLVMASELGGISRSRSGTDLLLTLHGLALRGERLMGQDRLERSLASLPATPESLGALIQSATMGRSADKVMAVVLPILDSRQYEEELEVNVAGSTACLAVGDWATALQFWYRHLQGAMSGGERPNDPGRLYALWARELSRSGRTLRPGLMFDPKTHLPETALECLVMAHERSPDDMGILRSLDALARDVRGMEPLRMQLLSHQSLHDQESWRIGLELALVNLRAFRKREGLEELELAFALARKRSKEEPFLSMLMSRDPSGRILRSLKETIARCEGKAHA
jgi:hypothetical protein